MTPTLVFFLSPEVPGFCPAMGAVLSVVTASEPDNAFSAAFLQLCTSYNV